MTRPDVEQSMALNDIEAMKLSGDIVYCGLQCGVIQKLSMRKKDLHKGRGTGAKELRIFSMLALRISTSQALSLQIQISSNRQSRQSVIVKCTKNGSYFDFPGYYVNASPASCKLIKQFTEGESCITALDVDIDGRVVVVGDINGEIHGYLTGLATNSIYFC